MPQNSSPSTMHAALIADQFTRQAANFAEAPELHNEQALNLLVAAGDPASSDETLDVACGPGTIVLAFAKRARRSVGLDATEAMLDQARQKAQETGATNVAWHRGDVYRTPFEDNAFDIVSCRFAFHHLERPFDAFAEMTRICRPGGRIVLCDAVCADDLNKAEAFNRMERFRDPSTVEFRSLGFLRALFFESGLGELAARSYRVPTDVDRLVESSFPINEDRAGLKRMIENSIPKDAMGMGARFVEGGAIQFFYSAVILSAKKPSR